MKPTFLDKQVESKSRLNLLFSVPVITVAESYNLNDEEKDFLTNHEELLHTTGGTSYTKDCYILDHKTQYSFKKYIMKHVRDFAYNILKMNQNIEIYMTNSWVNYNDQYTTHVRHNHSNSLISGVFYISTEEDDKIILEHPNRKLLEMTSFEFKSLNLWNSCTVTAPCETNTLLLFPSWLNHTVAPNEKATKDRISISFNTFVRGTLGDNISLSELILK